MGGKASDDWSDRPRPQAVLCPAVSLSRPPYPVRPHSSHLVRAPVSPSRGASILNSCAKLPQEIPFFVPLQGGVAIVQSCRGGYPCHGRQPGRHRHRFPVLSRAVMLFFCVSCSCFLSRRLFAPQLRKWKGERPDETETPEDALAAAKKGFAFFQVGHRGSRSLPHVS